MHSNSGQIPSLAPSSRFVFCCSAPMYLEPNVVFPDAKRTEWDWLHNIYSLYTSNDDDTQNRHRSLGVVYFPLSSQPPGSNHRILNHSSLPHIPTHILCPVTSYSLPDSPNNVRTILVWSHTHRHLHSYTFTGFHSFLSLSPSVRANTNDEIT